MKKKEEKKKDGQACGGMERQTRTTWAYCLPTFTAGRVDKQKQKGGGNGVRGDEGGGGGGGG